MTNRRQFLQATSVTVGASVWPVPMAFANAPTEKRLVFVFLRGGLDGMHLMPPWADADYRRLRPRLALPAPGEDNGVLDLDGYFGLHPALMSMHNLYRQKELVIVPASTTRYQQRSHFDAQNMLENGSGKPYGARDGWLNRAIQGVTVSASRAGLALGPSVPLILQGDNGVQTWSDSRLPKADDDFLMRMSKMYQGDPLFAQTLRDASQAMQPNMDGTGKRDRRRNNAFATAAKAAADLLSRDNGPRIAVMGLQGWDTHFAQQRRLTSQFKQLSQGVDNLKQGLGEAWKDTVVLVVSEFGRTAAENASGGTDHGTGGVAVLVGGAVNGGRIQGKWPGLSSAALHEGRDLRRVNYYESIFKTVLISHLGLSAGFVEDKVLPNSARIEPMPDLMRST